MLHRFRFPTLLALAVAFIALALVSSGGAGAAASPRTDVIIGFTQRPGPGEQALVRQAGGSIKYTYHLVPAIAASVPEAAIAGLQANPKVTSVDLDGEVHAIDAELDSAWGVKRIGAGTVHVNFGNKGTGVKVAVIDSGIDYTHPDLDANFAGGHDFVNDDTDPMDDNGHGTHVSGTVAAEDNGIGVVGVAPEAALHGLKVLNSSGSGSWSDIIAALQWAVDNGIQVTNNSYGASQNPGGTVQASFDNSAAAGVLHVAASGNSGNPRGKGNNVIYPARYDSVIAVAATDSSDNRASFSSTGSQVELAAPGVSVNSTLLGGGYGTGSGTSMASPHVAGTAALVIAAGVADARTQLQTTADDLGDPGRDPQFGFGLVDADEAATPSAPDTTAPVISNLAATNISDTSADITWTTDEPADSWVDYGLDATYGSFVSDGSLVTTHGITLTGLGPSNEYHYEVTSADAASNSASSAEFTFTSAAPDTTSPVISDVTATDVTDTSAAITWTTDEPADSLVDYGSDATYGSFISDASLVTSHSITLTGLEASTEYHYAVTSADGSGNSASSADLTFTTAVAPTTATTVSVDSITYATNGGKNGDKHLLITVALVDDLGDPVSGASVSIDLYRSDSKIASGTGTTGTDGTLTFTLNNASSGCYTTDVTDVDAVGLTWVGGTPTNQFCK